MAKTKQDLKAIRNEQLASRGALRTAESDDSNDVEDGEEEDESDDPEATGDIDLDKIDLDDLEDDGGSPEAMGDDEDEMDEDDDSEAMGEDEDDLDEDEMDEDDDSEAGDVTIKHDDDTGKLSFEHEMDEDDDSEAATDDPDESEDDPDESEDDDSVEGWVEANLVSGMLETALLTQESPSSRKSIMHALMQTNRNAGADFVKTLSNDEIKRLVALVDPIIEEGTVIRDRIQNSDARADSIANRLRKSGKVSVANQMEVEYRQARIADVENSDYQFECPDWLERKASAYLEATADDDPEDDDDCDTGEDDGDGDSEAAAIDLDEPADLTMAKIATELVNSRRSSKAAKLVCGFINDDTKEAVQVLAKLVTQHKYTTAAAMVTELRAAGYNVDPDVKPVQVDPSQPVTPGAPNRMMGPPPDAGFSYGMDQAEVEKACSALQCGPDTLSWVAALPKNDSGKFDPNGKVACYAEAPGSGATSNMSVEEAKGYLNQRANTTVAVLCATAEELGDIGGDDVVMLLHAANEEDPFWNVIVKGSPFGAIHLTDQPHAEVIASTFRDSNTYATGVRDNIIRFGLEEVFRHIPIRRYAAVYSEGSEYREMRERISTAAAEEAKKLATAYAGDLVGLMLLAHAGFTRNIWPIENPLKFALHARLSEAGVRDPDAVLEEALAMPLQSGGMKKPQSAMEMYIGLLAAKAEDFFEMEPKALAEVSKHILGAPIQLPDGVEGRVASASETLRERLVRGSSPVTAGGADNRQSPDELDISNLRGRLQVGRRWNS